MQNQYSCQDVSYVTLVKQPLPVVRPNYITNLLVCGSIVASSALACYNFNDCDYYRQVEKYIVVEQTLHDAISLYMTVEERYALDKKDAKYREILGELRQNILSFKTLSPNWDGFGAVPVGVHNAASALNMLDILSPRVIKAIDDCYPETNGTISIKWANNLGERVSVSIGKTLMSYYVLSTSPKTVEYYNNKALTTEEIDSLNNQVEAIICV